MRLRKKDVAEKMPIALYSTSAYYLLRTVHRVGYCTDAYGWACDVYNINGRWITRGFRPIGEYANTALVEKYNKKAREIDFLKLATAKEYHNKVMLLLNELLDKLNEE